MRALLQFHWLSLYGGSAMAINPSLSMFRPSVRFVKKKKRKHVDEDVEFKPIEEREEAELARNTIIKKQGFFKPHHTIEEQIRYMNSQTYIETYKNLPLWNWYKRNYPGQEKFRPRPRLFCIDKYGRHNTNNPCPICRDEYLYFDHRNLDLLKQFLHPGTLNRMEWTKSGLCNEQYTLLNVEVLKAVDRGYLKFNIPFRNFDYREYYDWWTEPPLEKVPEYNQPFKTARPKVYELFAAHNENEPPFWDPWWSRWDEYAKKK